MVTSNHVSKVEKQEISVRERERRRASIDAATGSLRLEGFVLDDDIVALNERFINGEIDREELGCAIRAALLR
jgi:Antitoxin VbhA